MEICFVWLFLLFCLLMLFAILIICWLLVCWFLLWLVLIWIAFLSVWFWWFVVNLGVLFFGLFAVVFVLKRCMYWCCLLMFNSKYWVVCVRFCTTIRFDFMFVFVMFTSLFALFWWLLMFDTRVLFDYFGRFVYLLLFGFGCLLFACFCFVVWMELVFVFSCWIWRIDVCWFLV